MKNKYGGKNEKIRKKKFDHKFLFWWFLLFRFLSNQYFDKIVQ